MNHLTSQLRVCDGQCFESDRISGMMLPSPMEKSEKAHHLLRKEVQQLTAKGMLLIIETTLFKINFKVVQPIKSKNGNT